MNRNTKIYLSIAIILFAAMMFCFGSKYAKPVANEIMYGIALLGAVFSILTRMACNKEKENAVKDNL